jgi:hypothetical protein
MWGCGGDMGMVLKRGYGDEFLFSFFFRVSPYLLLIPTSP